MRAKRRPTSKSRGGRPPKFNEPSRPVTLTLPESTLTDLRLVDPDRSRAIVKLTQAALGKGKSPRALVEIVQMAANTGLLVIGPSASLRRIPFLHLVEVAPARFLLAMDPGNDFKSLEIAVQDVLAELPRGEDRERELIMQLLENIRRLRRGARVSMAQILFVTPEPKRRR